MKYAFIVTQMLQTPTTSKRKQNFQAKNENRSLENRKPKMQYLSKNAETSYLNLLHRHEKQLKLWESLNQYEPLSCAQQQNDVLGVNEFPTQNITRADFARLKFHNRKLFYALNNLSSAQSMHARLSNDMSSDNSFLKPEDANYLNYMQKQDCSSAQQLCNVVYDLKKHQLLSAMLQLKLMGCFLDKMQESNSEEDTAWRQKALRDCWRVMRERDMDGDTVDIFQNMEGYLQNSIRQQSV